MGTDDPYDTRLHEAVRFGDINEVREALKEGCSPNQIGLYQWSPLHEASNNGDSDILQILLQEKGDPNKKDLLRGCTAMHYVASQGFDDCLKLLLKFGGYYSSVNRDGQSCLDVAVGECRKLLQEQRDEESILSRPTSEVHQTNILNGPQLITKQKVDRRLSKESEHDSLLDPDEISLASDTSSGHTHSPAQPHKQPRLGHVQLSTEHNAKRSTLKLRVWQVRDLLLPPADTSMISAIYVKSYLYPDKRKETKRKTEDVKIDQSDEAKEIKSGSTIFKPSHFKFQRPLEYENVTLQMIEDRILGIEVCIIQRYTRKSFPIASWNLPLRMAVKMLVKKKLPLKPCLSTTIPENMKVYDATDLGVVRSRGPSYPSALNVPVTAREYNSNPNLRRQASNASWATPYSEKAASDSHLDQVKVERPRREPSIEITVPEADDEELQECLQQIAIMEQRQIDRSASHTSSGSTVIDFDSDEVPSPGSSYSWSAMSGMSYPGSVASDPDPYISQSHTSLQSVQVENPLQMAEVEIHVPQWATSDVTSEETFPTPLPRTSKLQKDDPRHVKRSSTKSSKSSVSKKDSDWDTESQTQTALPGDLSWDYYSQPLEASSMLPLDFEDDNMYDPMSPRLPMALSFEMPTVHGEGDAQPRSASRSGAKSNNSRANSQRDVEAQRGVDEASTKESVGSSYRKASSGKNIDVERGEEEFHTGRGRVKNYREATVDAEDQRVPDSMQQGAEKVKKTRRASLVKNLKSRHSSSAKDKNQSTAS